LIKLFSWFHLQVIVETVFFVTILLLLWRLKRNIEKYRPLANGSVIASLKQIMTDSQESADGFIAMLEENKQTLSRLACQLDEKERRLAILIEEADAAIKKLDEERVKSESAFSKKRYDDVIDMVRKGMSREELAGQPSFNEDEINLIMAFARAKTEQSS
jgi:hypothetical protein